MHFSILEVLKFASASLMCLKYAAGVAHTHSGPHSQWPTLTVAHTHSGPHSQYVPQYPIEWGECRYDMGNKRDVLYHYYHDITLRLEFLIRILKKP